MADFVREGRELRTFSTSLTRVVIVGCVAPLLVFVAWRWVGLWAAFVGFGVGIVLAIVGSLLRDRRLGLFATAVSERTSLLEFARGDDEIAGLARELVQLRRERDETHSAWLRGERTAAFGALAAGITHEVKNPITALVGFAQLAQKKADSPDKVLELLRIIESEGLRCRDILSNFLKFARGCGDSWEPVDLNQIARETTRVLHHQLIVNGVHLEVRVNDERLMVMGNAMLLQQVIVNLALNAQQAMPSGGIVTITTVSHDGAAVLAVNDTGAGIADEVKARLFEPFFTTKAASGGTGLGLSVCASIIKEHQGTLTVDSHVGQGTTFTLRIPACASPSAP